MAGISLRRFAGLVLVVHVTLEVFCLAVPIWHSSVALRRAASPATITLSPHEWCLNSVCSSYSDYPYPIGPCDPPRNAVRGHARASQAMFILTACLSFIAASLSVFLTDKHRVARILTYSVIFLSFTCNVIGAGIFANLAINTVVCSNGPCFHLSVLFSTFLSCQERFDYPYYLASVAAILPLVALALVSVSSCLAAKFRRSPAKKYESPHSPDGAKTRFVEAPPPEPAHPQSTPAVQAKGVVEVTPSTIARPHGGEAPLAPTNPLSQNDVPPRPTSPVQNSAVPEPSPDVALPPGEWEFDDESGLYWSQDQFLFFHTDSGQFYDPNTLQWYNPDTDEWYTA